MIEADKNPDYFVFADLMLLNIGTVPRIRSRANRPHFQYLFVLLFTSIANRSSWIIFWLLGVKHDIHSLLSNVPPSTTIGLPATPFLSSYFLLVLLLIQTLKFVQRVMLFRAI